MNIHSLPHRERKTNWLIIIIEIIGVYLDIYKIYVQNIDFIHVTAHSKHSDLWCYYLSSPRKNTEVIQNNVTNKINFFSTGNVNIYRTFECLVTREQCQQNIWVRGTGNLSGLQRAMDMWRGLLWRRRRPASQMKRRRTSYESRHGWARRRQTMRRQPRGWPLHGGRHREVQTWRRQRGDARIQTRNTKQHDFNVSSWLTSQTTHKFVFQSGLYAHLMFAADDKHPNL